MTRFPEEATLRRVITVAVLLFVATADDFCTGGSARPDGVEPDGNNDCATAD